MNQPTAAAKSTATPKGDDVAEAPLTVGHARSGQDSGDGRKAQPRSLPNESSRNGERRLSSNSSSHFLYFVGSFALTKVRHTVQGERAWARWLLRHAIRAHPHLLPRGTQARRCRRLMQRRYRGGDPAGPRLA